ncbi:hypothetical protein B0J11DRAFT_584922 [Dendryphion nanum]|uniref:Uncharacterized protein n=1 Tax=Dendryphion nanum TaxID=256645 RepID=A0A9P9D777_9PLEO|nr:hypothetical protein B0J11DRAFT_584922 [Dendryphion nanum]
MKIAIASLLLAAPLMVNAACHFSFFQTANWDESGRRYRVRATASGDDPNINTWRMIEDFCNIYRDSTSARALPNPICSIQSPERHLADADTSEPHGPSGVHAHHLLYEEIIKELKRTYRFCTYVNHAAY